MNASDTLKQLRKMLRYIDHDIGVAAALRDEEMRETAEWKRDVLDSAVLLIEGIAAKP